MCYHLASSGVHEAQNQGALSLSKKERKAICATAKAVTRLRRIWAASCFLKGEKKCKVNEEHEDKFLRFAGWWGHDRKSRFEMEHEFKPIPGAAGFQLSNPPLLSTMSLLGALNVFAKTSMKQLRTKSKLLTAYLELLLLYHFGNPDNEDEIPTKRQQLQNGKSPRNNIHVSIVTPINPSERGCQLSVKFSMPIKSVHDELEKRGVVVDTREPDVMRIAPAPLYNSFMDVYRFVTILGEAIDALECAESEK